MKKEVVITQQQNRLMVITVSIFLALWFGWFFFHPLDLLPADLGRHIANGRIMFTQPADAWKVLTTNYYSYTVGNAPFINHHWLSGVIFYVVWRLVGFFGLQVFNILLNLLMLGIFFRLAVKRAGFTVASLVAIFLVPLMTERTEIRPEIFSYIFLGIYYTMLSAVAEGTLSPKKLYWLLPLQILWVNLHIYFFLGPFLVFVFWLTSVYKKLPTAQLAKPLGLFFLASGFVNLLNPSHIFGVLYPALIFTNYGIRVSENMSIYAFDAGGRTYANLFIFKITAIAVFFTHAWWLLKRASSVRVPDVILTVLFTIWAFSAIRNLAIFGLFALVTLSSTIALWPRAQHKLPLHQYAMVAITVFIGACLVSRSRIQELAPHQALGLARGNGRAAEYIIDNKLPGPMFNDFDIGSYAIFYLFPTVRPYIDNRAEAHPPGYIANEYSPLLLDDAKWKEAMEKNNFNLILFSFEDHGVGATRFTVARILDPEWAPVYADNYALVMLRRTPQNAEFIKTHEMSKDRFGVVTDEKK